MNVGYLNCYDVWYMMRLKLADGYVLAEHIEHWVIAWWKSTMINSWASSIRCFHSQIWCRLQKWYWKWGQRLEVTRLLRLRYESSKVVKNWHLIVIMTQWARHFTTIWWVTSRKKGVGVKVRVGLLLVDSGDMRRVLVVWFQIKLLMDLMSQGYHAW